MIHLRAQRSTASAGQIEAAMAGLEQQTGIYFGVDAGVPDLHPLQATLLVEPALAFRLYGDGLEVEALAEVGHVLLAQPELVNWRASARRGPGISPLTGLRSFLACFAPSPDVLLLGVLPFAAHRLNEAGSDAGALGVFYFGQQLFRREGASNWHQIRWSLPLLTPDPPLAVKREPPKASPMACAASDEPRDDYPPGGYADMVRRALASLQSGELVSLTLSQSYRRHVVLPAVSAFKRLRAANPAPASFFVSDGTGLQLFGASPDLQLIITSGQVQALPVCGTVARRKGAVGEAESLRELINEEVDAASLAVCTDALRNDLAALCVPGSLQLLDRRRPMSLATVVHAVDRLQGRLREGIDAWDAIAATAAPVMVTGTPRRQALEAIDQFEASPRGWYGGLVVQVASNGDALVGTILRAATVRNGVAEVRTGGDLMADSSPQREEQESRLKTRSLWRAFELEATPEDATARHTVAVPAAVSLVDAADPFPQAMRDCLLGLGMDIRADAPCSMLIGLGHAADASSRHLVAVGDAALRLLGQCGCKVLPVQPENGRKVLCTATPVAPWHSDGPFVAAVYASFALQADTLPADWLAWAVDEQGRPTALAHAGRRLVCLLFRPDSLLSEPQALQVLRAALAFSATSTDKHSP